MKFILSQDGLHPPTRKTLRYRFPTGISLLGTALARHIHSDIDSAS